MTYGELEHCESELRACFMKRLKKLDVDGTVTLAEAKEARLMGDLWHCCHELMKAWKEEDDSGAAAASAAAMRRQHEAMAAPKSL